MVEETPLTPRQRAWLTATASLAVAPLLPEQPTWVGAIVVLLIASSGLFIWRRWPLPPSRLVSLLALAIPAAVAFEYRMLFGLAPGIALLTLFCAAKLFEARRRRDGQAVVWLSWFLILARFVFDQEPVSALYAVGATLVSLATLAALVVSEPLPPAPLLRRSGSLMLTALPLAAVFFLLVPRISGPLWSLPRDAYSAVTGLSEEMTPGRIAELARSEAIAFRVRFSTPPPPRRDLYWRGPVLEAFDGRSWKSARGHEPAPLPETQEAPIEYEVTLEPHRRRWLFALEWPLAVPSDARFMSDGQLLAEKPVLERRRDRFRSRLTPPVREESPEILARNLELPAASNPRAQALAADWRALPPAARVEAATAFIARGGFQYTLSPPLLGEQAIDEFLFITRRGFCEHFAAAFVLLMRAAGVPARVVTGYQGGSHNPVDDTWVIRQADAHAWAEVWLEGRGWRRVDPTAFAAPARLDFDLAAAVPANDPLPLLSRPAFDWLREVRFRWWALQNGWNQWVLGYTPERQRALLQRLGMATPDWKSMLLWLALASAAALGLSMLPRGKKRLRRDPASRSWRRVTKRLARVGLPPKPWEGPLAYAQRVAAARPAKAAEIQRIATLYCGLRYGRLGLTARDELARASAAFRP